MRTKATVGIKKWCANTNVDSIFMSGESFGRRENLKKDLMERNDIILTVLKLKLCYDAGKQILESELINIRTDTFVFLFTVNGAELLEGKQKFNFFLSASVSLLIIS